MPSDVPPVIGMAEVGDPGDGKAGSEWRVHLKLPKVTWQVVGEVVPKSQWPELRSEIELVTLDLRFGGPSALAPSRIVNTRGEDLDRDAIIDRLTEEQAVLVSVSGRMPDSYHLQLTRPEALIVILGARDGAPAPEFLAAGARRNTPAERGQKPRMKGVELYSWKDEDDRWIFTLVEGTNRRKTAAEIKNTANRLDGSIALADALAGLAAGEHVIWIHHAEDFELPPEAIQKEIAIAAEEAGIQLAK